MGSILLQVAVGGAIGAVGRFLTGKLAARVFGTEFPYGTLAANTCGCLVMGFAFVLLAGQNATPAKAEPFILTGVLGGYTTMSAYSLDFWLLLTADRSMAAFGYMFGTIALAAGALFAGIALGRWAAG